MAKKRAADTPTRRGRPSKPAPKPPRGRPRGGLRAGEAVSEYQRMTLRLPTGMFARLDNCAKCTRAPRWAVVYNALDAYLQRFNC
jgi:hypothetical protein